jgi:two-component system response regulator VicR
MGFGVVEAGCTSFHYPKISSFPASTQEKLGLATKAFVFVKAVGRIRGQRNALFAHPPVVNLQRIGILAERLEASMTDDDPRRVVYIEDEQEMIDLVRLILSRKGFEVIGANGGREGLDEIRKTLPDLVLLDLMMPDMDGWEVYQQMKAEEPTRQIPVIIITAKAQNIDKVLGLHIAKVDDYISKPFSPKELVDSVERVLADHKVEDGS